ncbi:phosphatidate cytidylyltransferase [bacterium]|nr:phosphatidate cytidylyltransferase [bacterium]
MSTLYWGGSIGLTCLGTFVVGIAAIEYALLFEHVSLWLFSFLLFFVAVYMTQVFSPEHIVTVLCMSFILLSSLGICLFRQMDPPQLLAKLQWPLLGLIYVALFPALAIQVLYDVGWQPLMFLLVTVFFGDIFAFFSGLYWGQRKIFPQISPKKTIAGSVGGLVGSLLCGGVFLLCFSQLRDGLLMVFICLAIGAFAQLGDFFESLLKRISGKKDSGHIMPGHGGILDRLDGVYFGAPVLYFFCHFFNLASYF